MYLECATEEFSKPVSESELKRKISNKITAIQRGDASKLDKRQFRDYSDEFYDQLQEEVKELKNKKMEKIDEDSEVDSDDDKEDPNDESETENKNE